MKNKIVALFAIISFAFPLNSVSADEIVITANGDSTQNNVNVVLQNTTNVTQTNTSDVQNNVSTNVSTGSNTASENNGNTQISTGDIKTQTNVENNINTSKVSQTPCCQDQKTQTEVSGNGSNSQNSINQVNVSTTTVSTISLATVTTNIQGTASTGSNTANENTGNATISTGNIKVQENIENTQINNSQIIASSNQTLKSEIKIANNGANSKNTISSQNSSNVIIIDTKKANIFNSSVWILETGKNNANKNVGDVSITTGDIEALFNIKNYQINSSNVKVGCLCSVPSPKPGDGGQISDPSDPGSSSGGSSNSSNSNSSTSSDPGSGPQILGLAATNGIMPTQIVCDEPKYYYQLYS